MNSTASIWVIGSSNVDLIMKMPRLPAVGETVTNAEFLQTFGGKGANSAVGAARAGGRVVFVNAVGEDPYVPALRKSLADAGVDLTHLRQESGVASGHALVMIGDAGRNYLSVAPGANHRLLPEHIEALRNPLALAARILIQNEILPETNEKVLQLAEEIGIPVQWNCAPYVAHPRGWLKRLDMLVVNENEAADFARDYALDQTSFRRLAHAIQALGPKAVLITLGASGVEAASEEFSGHVPAFPVKAVDTTGAGDIFCGALAVALVEGRSTEAAIRFASAASAISVTRLGAQPSAPSREEIEAFLKNN